LLEEGLATIIAHVQLQLRILDLLLLLALDGLLRADEALLPNVLGDDDLLGVVLLGGHDFVFFLLLAFVFLFGSLVLDDFLYLFQYNAKEFPVCCLVRLDVPRSMLNIALDFQEHLDSRLLFGVTLLVLEHAQNLAGELDQLGKLIWFDDLGAVVLVGALQN